MKLRIIPTKVHGAIDYVTSPALVAAPEVLRLDGERGSALAPRLAGTTGALYSALTDYELGVRRVIPMRAHLALDAIHGTMLAASPWLSGSSRQGQRHWLPHALIGAGEIALALTTKTEARRNRFQRTWTAVRRAPETVAELPRAQRAAAIAVPVVLVGALAYAARGGSGTRWPSLRTPSRKSRTRSRTRRTSSKTWPRTSRTRHARRPARAKTASSRPGRLA